MWKQEHLYEQPGSSATGFANHEYYWTKNGITVIYESGYLGSHADGERRYPISKSYLKY